MEFAFSPGWPAAVEMADRRESEEEDEYTIQSTKVEDEDDDKEYVRTNTKRLTRPDKNKSKPVVKQTKKQLSVTKEDKKEKTRKRSKSPAVKKQTQGKTEKSEKLKRSESEEEEKNMVKMLMKKTKLSENAVRNDS